ncbi:hypothetical protein CK203_116610 [Vitis vinifera]|uniref:Uncharacterized protein n=1 Tax=Vitis vinifera TaxID=29760 RepID=A0A438C8K9_VITVI|nr:hypothetical protein CK203_116610 [Vitis vinifera]
MSEGFFFGPHHLIMAALLYLREGSQKKLQRADCIPSSSKAAMPNFGASGYPSEPQQRKRICREPFTLDKWNNMTAYKVDQPGQPQPAARRASPRHIPEGITLATPAILELHQLHLLHHSHPHQLSRGWPFLYPNIESLCRALETLTASQSNLAQEMAAIKACQADVSLSGSTSCHLRQLKSISICHKL